MELFIRRLGNEFVLIPTDYLTIAESAGGFMRLNPSGKHKRCSDIVDLFTVQKYSDNFLVNVSEIHPAVGLNEYEGDGIDLENLEEGVREALGLKKLGNSIKKRLESVKAYYKQTPVGIKDCDEPLFAYVYEEGTKAANTLGVQLDMEE